MTLFDKHGKALVALCSEGLTMGDACEQRGLRYKTIQGWLEKGRREPDGRYGAFTRAVEEARAKPVQDNKPPGEVYQATRLTLLGLKLGQEHELGKAQALALAETIDELRHTKGGAAATGMAKLSERLEGCDDSRGVRSCQGAPRTSCQAAFNRRSSRGAQECLRRRGGTKGPPRAAGGSH